LEATALAGSLSSRGDDDEIDGDVGGVDDEGEADVGVNVVGASDKVCKSGAGVVVSRCPPLSEQAHNASSKTKIIIVNIVLRLLIEHPSL